MNIIILHRAFLLAGLVGHKRVWILLKRRQGGKHVNSTEPLPLKTNIVKACKLVILLSILAQTLIPESWWTGQVWLSHLLIVEDSFVLAVVGTTLFAFGLMVAILGRTQLGDNWSDIETAQVLEKQRVVSRGLYRYIRHPIYTGDLMLLCGLELALNNWLVLGVFLLMPIVMRKAVQEETMLMEELEGYAEYCTETTRFIPFVV